MLFTLHPLLVTLFERLAIRDFFLEHEHHFTPTGRGAADCQEIMNRAIAPETDAVTIARRRLPPLAACRGISPPPVDRARPGRFFQLASGCVPCGQDFSCTAGPKTALPNARPTSSSNRTK